jgi:hypothetical protein
MNLQTPDRIDGLRPWQRALWRSATALLLLTLIFGPLLIYVRAPAASAQACNIDLEIYEFDATLGEGNGTTAIANFSYLINEDNAADPFDPDPSQHPGVRPMPSYSPIVAAGDQSTASAISLEPGRYLISVRGLDNPGTGDVEAYKLWGKHVRVPDDCGAVRIELTREDTDPLGADPNDELPLSQLRVHAFEDNGPVNGFPDFAGVRELGLAGFHVIVHDVVGEVTVDWFGNPLCTEYVSGGGPGGYAYDSDGNPIPVSADGDAYCQTDANGDLLIRNLPYGKYEVQVIPPDGSAWVQTTTFEGTHVIDAWLEEGADGRGPEGLIEPGLETSHIFGFVQPMSFPAGPTGSIAGQIKHYVPFPPGETFSVSAPVYKPWIALTDIGGDDEQVFTGRGDANGNFTISNVPAGTYQLAIWDDPLDLIMAFYTVQVGAGEQVNMGDVGVFRWFGWVSGDVFLDDGLHASRTAIPGNDVDGNPRAGNGRRDCVNPAIPATCEVGIPGVDLDIRHRDGSIRAATFTDPTGYYEYPEALSKMLKMEVAEVGFGRFARTGHSLHDEQRATFPDGDHDGDTIPNKYDDDLVSPVPQDLGGGLLLNQYTLEGKRSIIDWGKVPYDTAAGENGGVSGVVIYAVTRNEFNARLALAEDYEPGIPSVHVNLWGLAPGGDPNDPNDYTVLLNEVDTDAWSHPRPDHPDLAQSCDVRDVNGDPLTNPASVYVAQNCIEVPMLGNETKAGAFDGGYAFESMFPSGTPGVGPEAPLPPGTYVVEVETPPFYQILKEEDQNTDEGDYLQAIEPLAPPFPCVGPDHLVSDPRNPFDGQDMPLCNKRLVRIQAGQNAAADFFLFTDSDADGDATTRTWDTTQSVPMPGRFFGLVEDNLILNADKESITYGELRSVAGIPIGIYDYSGRRLTTVYTDENGFYEVLLPSSYTALCPIPSGVCPGMYMLVVDDPGDPADPNLGFKATYRTEPYVLDIWPAKMTPSDTPIQPISTLVCSVPPDVPAIFDVSQPYLTGAGALSLVIKGTRFGDTITPPTVTLDDDDGFADPVALALVAWTPSDPAAITPIYEDTITVTVPGGLAAGMYQLLVTNNVSSERSLNGLTFHRLGAGYNPPLVFVDNVLVNGSGTSASPFNSIQAAIDAAPAAGDQLIIIRPGTYPENVILHKNVKLQGYGPGGIVGAPPFDEGDTDPPPTEIGEEPFAHIEGSVIDGRYYNFIEANRLAWAATLSGPASAGGLAGPTPVPDGAAITVVGNTTEHEATFRTQIDGLGITTARGQAGGGIYVHAFGRNLIISNNILENNSGNYGGAITLGQPMDFGGLADNENDNVLMHYNRILGNGGVFKAGGVGIFNGADNYEFAFNDVCGNYSVEYGGGVSHFGLSPNGKIHDNLIYYNDAFDEGGGIMIAGELAAADGGLGSGAVDVTHNLIQANLSNDDGGGIRLLAPLTYRVNIVNNMIVNNVATDFGGGIALDDASNVTIVNNTIADNKTTATAEDSDGLAHGAGLVSEGHSAAFQAMLPGGAATFSNPVLFNNIFWNNQAFTWDGAALIFDSLIDFEVFGTLTPQFFNPAYSILSVAYGGGSNNQVGADPLFVTPTDVVVTVAPSRPNLRFISVQLERPEGTLVGFSDYHVQAASPAIDDGVSSLFSINAPCDDFDHDGRPNGSGWDIGADEQPGVPGNCGPASLRLYFSRISNVTPPGVVDGDDANVYTFNTAGGFGLALNATSVGVPSGGGADDNDVDALKVISGTSTITYYLSFKTATALPTIGTVQDEDIVRWNGTAWSLYFDGTALGLGGSGEDVDAFEILPNGNLIISADDDAVDVPGVTGEDEEDLLQCAPTLSGGVVTACTWTMYFDGSDVGLATSGAEDIDGVAVRITGSVVDIYLSTNGNFGATGPAFSGSGEDVWVCQAATTGAASDCTSYTFYYDGSGLSDDDLDAFDLP